MRTHASIPLQTQDPGWPHCVGWGEGRLELGVHTGVWFVKSIGYSAGYVLAHLEEILKVGCGKVLHLRYIVGKPANGILSEWSDQTEPKVFGACLSALIDGYDRVYIYLRSSSLIALGEWTERIRRMWMRSAFHTPSSNSCNRSTVSSEYTSRSGRLAMKAFSNSPLSVHRLGLEAEGV